jgi:hypothetical protein
MTHDLVGWTPLCARSVGKPRMGPRRDKNAVADVLTTIIPPVAVAAAVSGVALFGNGWRERASRAKLQQMQLDYQTALRNLDRQHEAALRELDRQQEAALRERDRRHESRLQELADLRSLRDLKIQRLRTNLGTLVDVALKLGDREFQLRMEPLRFVDPDPGPSSEPPQRCSSGPFTRYRERCAASYDGRANQGLRQLFDCAQVLAGHSRRCQGRDHSRAWCTSTQCPERCVGAGTAARRRLGQVRARSPSRCSRRADGD